MTEAREPTKWLEGASPETARLAWPAAMKTPLPHKAFNAQFLPEEVTVACDGGEGADEMVGGR